MIRQARETWWVRLFVGLTLLFICAPAAAQESDAIEACFSAYEETQEHLKAKEYEKARELSRQCSQGCPAEITEQCQKWTWQAERDAPSVILVARLESGEDAPEVQVAIDGEWRSLQKEILLDPGPHQIVFSRDDGWTHSLDVTIHAGEKRRTIRAAVPLVGQELVAPVEPTTKNPHHPWAIASFTVGAAGFAVAGAFTLMALRQKSDLDACAEESAGCIEADVRKAQQSLTIADVGLAVGVIGSATGLGILIWGKPNRDTGGTPRSRTGDSRAVLGVAPAQGGFSTVLRGTF